MKRFFVCTVLLFGFFNFYFSAYAVEDVKEDTEFQTPSTKYQKLYKKNQLPRPILPPTVPSSSSGVSPTPSPHIAVPPVTPRPIRIPSFPTVPQFPEIHKSPMHNLPSTPVHVAVPVTNALAGLPQVPMIGSLIGRVINIGQKEDEGPWIEVKGEFVKRTLKIKVDPQSTPVAKKGSTSSFKDIKIEDIVRVVFNQEKRNITAIFISILNEEDIKAIEETLSTVSTVTPEEEDVPSEE